MNNEITTNSKGKVPHKHTELIKKWADGTEIQVKERFSTQWTDCKTPSWVNDLEYRVKPKPMIRKYRYALKFANEHLATVTLSYYKDSEELKHALYGWHMDWFERLETQFIDVPDNE